jgi:hypothetical protein
MVIKPKLTYLYNRKQHIPTFDQQVFTKSMSQMDQSPIAEMERWILTNEQDIIIAAKQEQKIITKIINQ